MVTANGRLNSEAIISTFRILSDIKTVCAHQKVVDIFECGTLAFATFYTFLMKHLLPVISIYIAVERCLNVYGNNVLALSDLRNGSRGISASNYAWMFASPTLISE